MSDPVIQSLPGNRLRAMMGRGIVVAPGAFNGLVARAVADAGFDAAYVSGGAVSAASGVPDIGLVSLDGFCAIIRQVAASSGLPVIADADTGFGEVEMVARTVHAYHDAGAAGLHIEDQVFPKRCGHLEGKRLIAVEHFQEKLAAAARAREAIHAATGERMIVCARTDAVAVEGFAEAVRRSTAYAQAGADMIFPEAMTTEQQFVDFAAAMRSLPGEAPSGGPYLLAHMSEFGKTPVIEHSRLGAMGYHFVIHPVTTLRIAMRAVIDALDSIKRETTVKTILDRMQPRAELYQLLGYNPGDEWTYPGATRSD